MQVRPMKYYVIFMITHVSEMLLYLKLSFSSIETNGKIHADNF